jgi:hypothetical protein
MARKNKGGTSRRSLLAGEDHRLRVGNWCEARDPYGALREGPTSLGSTHAVLVPPQRH